MSSITLGRQLVARSAAVRRASLVARVSAAQAEHVPAEIMPVRLSSEPIGPVEMTRLVADLRHYCFATGIRWRDVEMGALDLQASETPAPVETPAGHHGRR